MESKTVYFDNTGRENSDAVFQIARKRADELGIKKIVVASTGGDMALKAMDIFKGLKVIVVTHVTGFKDPNDQKFSEETKKTVEGKGGIVLTTTHAFGGLSKAMRNKYNMFVLGEVIADTLRIFGQGMKVACELAMMAADSGLVDTGEDVISIAGSSRGGDTAILVKAVNTHNFFDLKVKEILCKPHF